MALQFRTLTPTTPTPRYRSPARRGESLDGPVKRNDNWATSTNWRNSTSSPTTPTSDLKTRGRSPIRREVDLTPAAKSWRNSDTSFGQSPTRKLNPFEDTNWRAGCSPSRRPDLHILTRSNTPSAPSQTSPSSCSSTDDPCSEQSTTSSRTTSPCSSTSSLPLHENRASRIEKPVVDDLDKRITTPVLTASSRRCSSTSSLCTDIDKPSIDSSSEQDSSASVPTDTQASTESSQPQASTATTQPAGDITPEATVIIHATSSVDPSPEEHPLSLRSCLTSSASRGSRICSGIWRLARRGLLSARLDHCSLSQARQEPPKKTVQFRAPPKQNKSFATSSTPTVTMDSDPAKSSTAGASTPKPKKHADSTNSQQKSRKASRTPAAPATVTPLKKQQYYAGPAFANSPAPSSLPIPKFFLQQEAGKASSADESPVAKQKSTVDATTKAMSGLDLLFNADRKEKAKQPATPEPATHSVYKDGQFHDLNEEQYRDWKSQQLRDLITSKPSTPPTRGALPQQMSAPPQFQTRPPDPSLATGPQAMQGQQPDNFHYGNRRLSPMFEAARQEPHSDSQAGIHNSTRPKHHRSPSHLAEHTNWDRFDQYSPNPRKTAAYQSTSPIPDRTFVTPYDLPNMPQPAPPLPAQSASLAEQSEALKKLLGVKK